ncbi:MAG: lipocalin family protein [Paludibacteraceae bacterium]|nr:lipocalin family protein [Paludibacteraceae bacterium]
MKKSFSFFALLGMLIPLSACEKSNNVNNTPIASVDLDRYLGFWYEIARFDHSFERNRDNCTAFYTLNTDGTIRVENKGWKGDNEKVSIGKAKTTDTPALLRVSFFGPFYSDYRILMLDADYTVALVGSKSDKYLWILSRTPMLDGIKTQAVLNEAQQRGYNTSKLIWVDQSKNMQW